MESRTGQGPTKADCDTIFVQFRACAKINAKSIRDWRVKNRPDMPLEPPNPPMGESLFPLMWCSYAAYTPWYQKHYCGHVKDIHGAHYSMANALRYKRNMIRPYQSAIVVDIPEHRFYRHANLRMRPREKVNDGSKNLDN